MLLPPLSSLTEKLGAFDRSLFFLLNGRLTWLDPFWLFWSSPWPWILMGIFLVVYLYRRLQLKVLLIAFVFSGILALATDQSANLAKVTFKRPRPCRAFPRLVHRTWPRCSDYGFFSGHGANSFGQAVFWPLVFASLARHGGKRKFLFKILLPWAFLISMSRIFTGVHYPFDLLAGAVAGMLIAMVFYILFRHILNRLDIFVS